MTVKGPMVVMDPPPLTRAAAIALARTGVLLSGRELRAILQIKASTYYYHQALGHYDRLKVKLPVGPRIYSGLLVTKWLDGEDVYLRTFGRKKA